MRDSASTVPSTRLDGVENQAVGLEHVLELAGVLPPALDDVRPDLEAAVDQVLNRVGDLQFVAEARLDASTDVEDSGPNMYTPTSARSLFGSFGFSTSGRRGRRTARRRRTSADPARAPAGSARPASRVELLDEAGDASLSRLSPRYMTNGSRR
jgi:hypothetical protein